MSIYVLTASCTPVIGQATEQIEDSPHGIDLTLIVAIAALVLSIISPFVSSWINGHYRKKKRNRMQQQNIKGITGNFMKPIERKSSNDT